MSLVVSFEVPLRVVNCSNAHEHHMVRARRVKATRQEFVTWARMNHLLPFVKFHAPKPPRTYAVARWDPPFALPLVITMTRLAPRRFDDDGAVASMKPIRDQLAELLGINDNDSRVTWVVKQEAQRTGAQPSVRITLERPEVT